MSKSIRWSQEQFDAYQKRHDVGINLKPVPETATRPKVYDNPEGRIVDAICTYLLIQKFVAIRINSGSQTTENRYIRFYIIKNNDESAGLQDIIAHKNNNWIQIEVKTPKGRLSDSQKTYKKLSESHGTDYHICRSLDDAIKLIGRIKNVNNLPPLWEKIETAC